jgi:hypothetical protein
VYQTELTVVRGLTRRQEVLAVRFVGVDGATEPTLRLTDSSGDGVMRTIYSKLFAPNNLSTVTPPGESYVAEWTDDELLLKLRDVVRQGLALVRSAVPP